jgi:hypothetical protein
MRYLLKTLLIVVFLAFGQTATATPEEDAAFIAQRHLQFEGSFKVENYIRSAFVKVYFRPLSETGVRIRDAEAFQSYIPDEEVQPYLEEYAAHFSKIYFMMFSPEKLAWIAAHLRADPNLSPSDVLDAEFRQKYEAAYEQSRAKMNPDASNDPNVQGILEATARLDAFTTFLEEEGAAEDFAKGLSAAVQTFSTLHSYHRDITKSHRSLNNPVTIAVLKADGVLQFSNPVQRNNLLRKLEGPTHVGGARFIKVPARKTTTGE